PRAAEPRCPAEAPRAQGGPGRAARLWARLPRAHVRAARHLPASWHPAALRLDRRGRRALLLSRLEVLRRRWPLPRDPLARARAEAAFGPDSRSRAAGARGAGQRLGLLRAAGCDRGRRGAAAAAYGTGYRRA